MTVHNRVGITPQNSQAIKQLIALGVIPQECTHFELILDPKEAIRAKCEFLVSEETMQKIADAFSRNPEEAAQILRTAKVSAHVVGRRQMEQIPDLVF